MRRSLTTAAGGLAAAALVLALSGAAGIILLAFASGAAIAHGIRPVQPTFPCQPPTGSLPTRPGRGAIP